MKLFELCLSIAITFIILLIPASVESHENHIIDDESMKYVVGEFAPIFIAPRYTDDGELCKYNIPTTLPFDKDWNPLNNEANYEKMLIKYPGLVEKPDLYLKKGMSNVYYEAIASETHIFITYYLFFPHDAYNGCVYSKPTDPGGHQNDATSIMLIIRNNNSKRKLEWIALQDHGESSHIAADEALLMDDRSFIAIKNGTHQLAPILTNTDFPYEDNYYFFGLTTAYRLQPIFKTIWKQRKNKKLFCTFFRKTGMRYCEIENKAEGRGTPPWAPWAREFRVGGVAPLHFFGNRGIAQSFTDPIRAFEKLYKGSNEGEYSAKYLYNPYQP